MAEDSERSGETLEMHAFAGQELHTENDGAARLDFMRRLAGIARRFDSISLAELGSAGLMDRVDRKFFVPTEHVIDILAGCVDEYRVLTIRGRRLARYRTRYFDTPELDLYHAHHAGRVPRYKVRIRKYLDTGDQFLEVKRKTNKGRTLKVRVPLDVDADPLETLDRERFFGLEDLPRRLGEEVKVEYTRLTLVHKDAPERLTLDMMLTFTHEGLVRTYPRVVIAELKQERNFHSAFVDWMRALNLREGSISKYCLGVVGLDSHARKNRFKQIYNRLEAIGQGQSPA